MAIKMQFTHAVGEVPKAIKADRVKYLLRAARSRGGRISASKIGGRSWRFIADCNLVLWVD